MTDLDVQSILLEHYPFNKILELTLIKSGVSNENYIFSDGNQKYIARVCLFEPENQLEAMIPFLKYAEITGYPAARIIQATDSRDYVYGNGNPIVVTSCLEGDSANNISIGTEHLKSLAQLVAQFHNMEYSPSNTPVTLDPDFIFDVYRQVVDYKPIDNNKDSLRLIELVDKYYKKFEHEKFTDFVKKLPQGITHGDINPGNVLINEDKAVSLLDFEELGVSWQLQDVAMILITWTYPEGRPNNKFIETFLKEYQLHRSLTKIEKENIVNAMKFIAFRQCVYAKRMLFKGTMKSVENFSSYWTLLHLNEHDLDLDI